MSRSAVKIINNRVFRGTKWWGWLCGSSQCSRDVAPQSLKHLQACPVCPHSLETNLTVATNEAITVRYLLKTRRRRIGYIVCKSILLKLFLTLICSYKFNQELNIMPNKTNLHTSRVGTRWWNTDINIYILRLILMEYVIYHVRSRCLCPIQWCHITYEIFKHYHRPLNTLWPGFSASNHYTVTY